MASKLTGLLSSEPGRWLLNKVIPLVLAGKPSAIGARGTLEAVPLDRIAWLPLKPGVERLPSHVANEPLAPVSLTRAHIAGESVYLVRDGNRRIELLRWAKGKTVSARVWDEDVVAATLEAGRAGMQPLLMRADRARLDGSIQHPDVRVDERAAEVLAALGLVQPGLDLAPARPRRRRPLTLGKLFGIGE